VSDRVELVPRVDLGHGRSGRTARTLLDSFPRWNGSSWGTRKLVTLVQLLSRWQVSTHAAGSWLARRPVLLRAGPRATRATAPKPAGSCCARDADAGTLGASAAG